MHLTPHNSYSRVEWKKVRITARFELWEVAIISKFWLQSSFWISVSAEESIQATGIWKQLHNNLQTNNFLNLLINQFFWKIFDIRLSSCFLFFPINAMVDFSEQLHNPFSQFQKRLNYSNITMTLLTSSINGFLFYVFLHLWFDSLWVQALFVAC